MLSDTPMSPRPLPPARSRRSISHSRLRSSTDQRPPPPYAALPDRPTLLGSPIGVTTKLMRLAEEGPEAAQAWMQERSKAELEELLQKAGSLIKDREDELDRTAVACKRLSTSNAVLKTENDSLLSRIPEFERDSLPVSPSSSFHTLVDAFSPSHSPSSSQHAFRDPPVWTPSVPTKKHRRLHSHARRPSATPAELAALADQNAELLTKLQDLESDAGRAEQAGKRRLKGLEKEIQGLKDELDRTRTASARLEETLQEQERLSKAGKQVFEGMPEGLEEDLVKMWKRLRRDEKVREMRTRTRPWEAQEENNLQDPKDFAPAAPWYSPKRSSLRKQVSCSTLSSNFESDVEDGLGGADQPPPSVLLSPNHNLPTSRSFPTLGHSVREQALVSRLLAKVHELEETNTQLASEHQEANRRLLDAETESESVKRLCEFINDEMNNVGDGVGALQLEMVATADLDSDDSGDQEDVFGSVSQSKNKDCSPKKKTVTLRSVRSMASLNFDLVRNARADDVLSIVSNASTTDPLHPIKGRRASPVSEQGSKLSRKYRKTVRGLFDAEVISSTPPLSPESSGTQDTSRLSSIRDSDSFDNVDALDNDLAQCMSEPNLPSLSAEIGDALDNDGFSLRSHRSFVHLRSASLAELLNSVESEPAALSPSPSSLTVPGMNASASSSRISFQDGSSKRRARTTFLDKSDQKGSIRLLTLARSKSSINLRSPSNTLWSFKDVSNLPKSASADPTSQDTKNKYRLVAFFFELWLWLQFAVLLLVVVYSMARRGPKTLIRHNAAQTSKPS